MGKLSLVLVLAIVGALVLALVEDTGAFAEGAAKLGALALASLAAYALVRFIALRFTQPKWASLIAMGVVGLASIPTMGVLAIPAAVLFLLDISKERPVEGAQVGNKE